ncbi:polysaccharide deacetylase family protein [Paracoccus ravus]|uniref:polysaccharide deacetylase family protein n=1 Tax=Paracoccus ravus TaxID=2447760 RepID=UPI001FD6F058|nr:polysaccharide deacetylase family protein [Paracoccus ravus]
MPSAIRMDMAERLSDLRGRGRAPIRARWPAGARLALSFVLNIEEGAERNILDGDPAAEHLNADMLCDPWREARNLVMESHYEYGSRVGLWRILDLFRARSLPLTAFAVGQALARMPEIAPALMADGHEVAAHGWRWIDYRAVPPEIEAEHIRRTVATIRQQTGQAPVGWYTGRVSANTRRLVLEHGGFLYDSDAYNDDTPYFVQHPGGAHLILPYCFDTNDMRFASSPGFDTGQAWVDHLVDTFDLLWREGERAPRMMSVGLHCRLAGKPARLRALQRFLDHVARHQGVWIARRDAIARHWLTQEDR